MIGAGNRAGKGDVADSLKGLGVMGPKPACVFLINDDPGIRAVVERALKPWGLDVICFASAGEGGWRVRGP